MKLLVTGFDPFGGEAVNPAYEALQLLPDRIAGMEIVRLEVPTVFGAAGETLTAAIRTHRPDAVLCVGQAGGRAAITPEQVAINLMDGRIPDNAGYQPAGEPVLPGGPDAYFSTLPVRAMAERIRAAGIPAAVSYTAGTYVCNYLMYTLLHLAATEFPGLRGGFIHVPYAMEQAVGKPSGTPSMDLRQIARGLSCAIEAIAAEMPQEELVIRPMEAGDIPALVAREQAQGWDASEEKFRQRLRDRDDGLCTPLTALYHGEPAGYLSVYYEARQGPFAGRGWPELVDFGVLEKFRRHGIGARLMDEAEQIAAARSDTVCLGVGLHAGYGSAQRMYIRRGYLPDGSGVWYGAQVCAPYADCRNDDELVLYLSKKLR